MKNFKKISCFLEENAWAMLGAGVIIFTFSNWEYFRMQGVV